MKLVVVSVGKLRDAWIVEGCAEYEKRVRARSPLELVEHKDTAQLTTRWPSRGPVWALDERGDQLTSTELARALDQLMNRGEQQLTFVIGAADGLPAELLARATRRLSLGKLTLPHRLCRLILLEQLYRALSILRGEPYHRE